jgi:hypothetical protein
VLITEGEKAAEAAAALWPEAVSTTWPGGARAVKHGDFQPLKGRHVVLWPDNDQPGREAMQMAAHLCRAVGASTARTSNIEALARRARSSAARNTDAIDGRADGAEGFTAEEFAVVRQRSDFLIDADVYTAPHAALPSSIGNLATQGGTRRFTVSEDGLWHQSEDRQTGELKPRRLSDRLDSIGKGRDAEGRGWCLVVYSQSRWT